MAAKTAEETRVIRDVAEWQDNRDKRIEMMGSTADYYDSRYAGQ